MYRILFRIFILKKIFLEGYNLHHSFNQIFSKTLEIIFSDHTITTAVSNTKERSYLIPIQTLDSFLSQ